MSDGWGDELPSRAAKGAPSATTGTAQLAQDVQTLFGHISRIRKCVEALGTRKDGLQLRRDLKSERDQATLLSKRLVKGLNAAQQDSRANPSIRPQVNRLRTQFDDAMHQLQMISDQSLRKEREIVVKLSGSVEKGSGFLNGSSEERPGGTQLVGTQTVQVDQALIEERNRGIKEIERDLADLAECYREFQTMVVEQGESIDHIEDNVSTTVVRVEEGRQEIEKATTYQKKARKKMCCLVIIFLAVALALALGLGLGL